MSAIESRPEVEVLFRPDDPELIATLAQLLWEDRGKPLGSAQEDWLTAERELRALIL